MIIINRLSKINLGSIVIGDINDDIPRINNMLKILEPITFPSAISHSHFVEAIIDVTYSGSDVPIAYPIVRPIKWTLSPNAEAMYEVETTTNLPPITMAIIPPIEYTIDLAIDFS